MNVTAASTTAAPKRIAPIALRISVGHGSTHSSANGVSQSVNPGSPKPSATSAPSTRRNTIAAGIRPSSITPGRRPQNPNPRSEHPHA